jgi:hypothetical protein
MIRKLSGINEIQIAIDQIVGTARRELYIFDDDLGEGGFGAPGRFEVMRRFLLANRANRVCIALHDTDYLTRYCARMMSLVRQFPHAIEIRRTLPAARHASDAFVLADALSYWRRYHTDDVRSELVFNDDGGGRQLRARFEEIWEVSEPAVAATVLGL